MDLQKYEESLQLLKESLKLKDNNRITHYTISIYAYILQ